MLSPDHLNRSISSLVCLRGWSIHGPIPRLGYSQRFSTSLYLFRVDAGSRSRIVHAHAHLISTLVVDVQYVVGVYVTGEESQDRQTNVDAEVYTAASDEDYAEGRH